MQEGNTEKAGRLLGIYTRLMNGDVVNVQVEAMRYKVDVRSFQNGFQHRSVPHFFLSLSGSLLPGS